MKQLILIDSNSALDEVSSHSQAMSWNYDMSRAKSVSDAEEKYIEAMENPDAFDELARQEIIMDYLEHEAMLAEAH
jgi:hypothetical protein